MRHTDSQDTFSVVVVVVVPVVVVVVVVVVRLINTTITVNCLVIRKDKLYSSPKAS